MNTGEPIGSNSNAADSEQVQLEKLRLRRAEVWGRTIRKLGTMTVAAGAICLIAWLDPALLKSVLSWVGTAVFILLMLFLA